MKGSGGDHNEQQLTKMNQSLGLAPDSDEKDRVDANFTFGLKELEMKLQTGNRLENDNCVGREEE